jgi:ribonucleoside-diphosphate reductase alpha chain
MVDLYQLAWRMGVKTTYYLHMMPRHQAEQSTVKVNKAAEIAGAGAGPRRGFGARPAATAVAPASTPTPTPTPTPSVSIELEVDVVDGAACPVDPQERLQCESCQ